MNLNKTDKKIKPVFIFSLPRSGSTLMQRILMSHSKISTTAEPHFLLPFVYANKKEGTLTNYSHIATFKGVHDIIEGLPNKEAQYYSFLRDFSLKIYGALALEDSVYFLDKTPRYIWIIEDILKIFPNAKFIFLFRSPIQIYASLVSTFSDNRFHKMYRFNNFLNEGFEFLSNGYRMAENNCYGIQYENFINNPKQHIQEIFDYLELDMEQGVLDNFNEQVIRGRSVDPTGIKLYSDINKSPLKKWKKIFNTKYRKKIIGDYLRSLDEESLSVQGYNKNELIEEIRNLNSKGNHNTLVDLKDNFKSKSIERFHLNLFLDSKMGWIKNKHLN